MALVNAFTSHKEYKTISPEEALQIYLDKDINHKCPTCHNDDKLAFAGYGGPTKIWTGPLYIDIKCNMCGLIQQFAID